MHSVRMRRSSSSTWSPRGLGIAVAVFITAATSGCRDVSGRAPAAEDTTYRTRPGYVVDSVRPIEVELERFRSGLGPAPDSLSGGASSIRALIGAFAEATASRDTARLQQMQVSAAEFAWLVYPSSPFTRPPYRESPQMVWYQLRAQGDPGLTRLLQRRGGTPIRILDHRCDPEPAIEGENRLWKRCEVRTASEGERQWERLFGVIIERRGHFKFASYQNQY